MATEPTNRPAARPADREESDDRLLGGRVRLIQPRAGYRAAIDPVLLAGAVPAQVGQAVLDLGAGSGAVSLCLAARVPQLAITALERQAEAAALCRRNIAANGIDGAIGVVEADLARLPSSLHGVFDHVVANPPYIDRREGTRPPDEGRAAAHADGDLGLWIDTAHEALRNKGWLTLIHRADRFDRIIARLSGRFGALTLIPLWPKQGAEAKRVIVRARKGVRSPGRLTGGLILHDDRGAYTAAAQAVLRDLAAIEPD
ncbi:MAG: methyltransferase [Pseudomonadota bacterium]